MIDGEERREPQEEPERPPEREPPKPPEREPSPAGDGETPTIVAVLLAAAAVVAAVIGARAASVGDDGSDTYHQSIRDDVKSGAALVGDVRFVYQEEAPLAFQIAESIIRSQESRLQAQGAGGLGKSLLEVDAGAQEAVVETTRKSSDLASDPKYELPNGGYDVLRRLADTRAESPDLLAIDADATAEEATDLNFESALLIATTVPAALAFLCGALANGFPTARPWLVPVGFALTGLSLILALVVEITH
jgi:hypothetical protein